MSANPVPAYAGIMLVTGIGIPVMAALNAGLGQRLSSPANAAVILFAVALVVALFAAATIGDRPSLAGPVTPVWFYLGGIFVAAYVLAITAIGPRFGIGNAVFFVLVGQLASAAVIDHFGLFGAIRTGLTVQRAAGILLMAAGVFLARKPL